MRDNQRRFSHGFTLVEIVVGLTILGIVAISMTALFTALVNSAVIAKQKAVASSLATNQMEYLKSLPYDNLAVAGGNPSGSLPPTTTQKVNGVSYTVKTSIHFVDDAYDGCISYPNVTLELAACRNFVVHAGAPTSDSNSADYKVAHVEVLNSTGSKLAEVDTEISARVAETASTTGALFVSVLNSSGAPVSEAAVHLVNTVVGPIDQSVDTDTNGIAIFYGLPPDTSNFDYKITASKTGYSTLTTIAPSGSLQPTYSSQKVITQQSSFVTLTIRLQGPDSLLVETTDTSGNALSGVKVYVKGGYKKYTDTTNTSYCYDNTISANHTDCSNLTGGDTRPTTDASGLASISNLVPGPYIFCGDSGSSSCTIGGTTYYLAAAIPYVGTNPLNPISVPTYDPANPPTTTFAYSGSNYYQKVRLMLTNNINFPRIFTLDPSEVSLGGGTISNFGFTITGANLPCNSNPALCSTTVTFSKSGNNYVASCTGTTGSTLNCTVDLSGVSAGNVQLSISANGNTLNLPASPLLGGLNVTP